MDGETILFLSGSIIVLVWIECLPFVLKLLIPGLVLGIVRLFFPEMFIFVALIFVVFTGFMLILTVVSFFSKNPKLQQMQLVRKRQQPPPPKKPKKRQPQRPTKIKKRQLKLQPIPQPKILYHGGELNAVCDMYFNDRYLVQRENKFWMTSRFDYAVHHAKAYHDHLAAVIELEIIEDVVLERRGGHMYMASVPGAVKGKYYRFRGLRPSRVLNVNGYQFLPDPYGEPEIKLIDLERR